MRRGRRTRGRARNDARRSTSRRQRIRPARSATRPRRRPEAPRAGSSRGLDGGVVASTAILASLGVVMIYSTTAPLAIGSALPPHLVRHLLASDVLV